MNEDQFRAILGPAFEELTVIGKQIEVDAEAIGEERLNRIRSAKFELVVPMTGEYALDLAQSLIHAEDDGCLDCLDFLADFVAAFIYTTWERIMEEIQ